MSFVDLLRETRSIFTGLWEQVLSLVPRLAGALVVLALGLLLARVFRSAVQTVVAGLLRLAPARFHEEAAVMRPGRLSELSGRFTFWLTLVLSFIGSLEVAGLPVLDAWFQGMTAYLPRLMVALLIGVSGIVVAVLVRDVVIRAAASARLEHPVLLGQLGYIAVLLVTFLFAVDQAGLHVWVLGALAVAVVAILLLGAALTFALGAQHLVTNILAAYFLQRTFRVGDRIRVGETEGRILQFTPVLVVIETAEGEVHLPNRSLMEGRSLRVMKKDAP